MLNTWLLLVMVKSLANMPLLPNCNALSALTAQECIIQHQAILQKAELVLVRQNAEYACYTVTLLFGGIAHLQTDIQLIILRIACYAGI